MRLNGVKWRFNQKKYTLSYFLIELVFYYAYIQIYKILEGHQQSQGTWRNLTRDQQININIHNIHINK